MRRLGALASLFAGFVLSACADRPATAPGGPPADGEWVYVSGDVEEPGRVPVLHGRTPFTLTQALAISGCMHESVVACITRRSGGEMTVDFESVLTGAIDDPEPRPDDIVVVTARR